MDRETHFSRRRWAIVSLLAIVAAFALPLTGGVAAAQDPQFAAGNWDGDTIELLDAGMESVGSFPAGGESPNGMAFDGNLIYSGHFSNETVYAYDFNGNIQFSWTRPELGGLQAMTFADGELIFSGAMADIFFVDPTDGSDIRDIPVPSECSGLEGLQAVDGNLWLLCGDLILIDASDGSLIESQTNPAAACSFSGTALAAIDDSTLVLGCQGGNWFFYDTVSESVIDSGDNGIEMFGLTSLEEGSGSGPDAASWASNRIDVVVRGTDDAIWHKFWNGTIWSGFDSLGGVATSDPASVSWSANRLDIFVRGTDNALWHRWFENGIWFGWESLGGVLTSAPDVASWGPNRLDVFARGTDGALWHRPYDGANGWGGWESLGGVLSSGPSAVSWDTNRIDVFVRGTDNAMWHRWFDGAHGWLGYESLGGVLTSDPDAASWGPNRLDIFVRGTDNALWHRWYDGANGWHGYESRGGVLTGPPGAVSPAFNRINVFVRGTDRALWHQMWNGTVWTGYESLGGVLK